LDASLVMRDRETDSWWSIMTSDAIGGDLGGAKLVVLPAGEKATWKDWRKRHPDTLVLSVEGEEHVDNNPYDNYFTSEGTFRDLEVEDDRLEPKDHIYTFWYNEEPWAISHKAFKGGAVLDADGFNGKRLFLYRSKKGPMYESSRAYLIEESLASAHKPKELLELAESGAEGVENLPGFDTFWYTWVAVNENTRLIR
jgi:hypothetical protein